MAEVSIYLDLLSQPSRSVYMFAKVTKIPVKYEMVQVFRGEHLTEEFGKINPFHKVPALKHEDFCLSESTAILLYLARNFNTPDHWYPSDLEKRARVDEYLAWQHTNTRLHAGKVFWAKGMAKAVYGEEICSEKLDPVLLQLNITLTNIEESFLQEKRFLVGDEISIADLMAIAELMQAVAGGLDLFKDRPKLAAWKQRVVAAVGEELFIEAHEKILTVLEKSCFKHNYIEGFKAKIAMAIK
uniref:glutathione transferase n=1 Tax=Leptobrachium leishanense TaxID=445787 RepID=A0A8C5LMH6_9ANUR